MLRPALHALTALHVGASEPVGTGVLRTGALGVLAFQDWKQPCPVEHVKLMRSIPNLLLLCRPRGPLERAFDFLRDLMQRGAEDSCGGWFCPSPGSRSSIMALDLWDRLRATGLQAIAPIMPALLAAGVPAWQLEAAILGNLQVGQALSRGRADHPQARLRKRASWAAAVEAAQPVKR